MTLRTETEKGDTPVELTARVQSDGKRFAATVDGLPLEGIGATPGDAKDALVQVVRGWLERQDTAGRLADALGVDCLDEDTEIVLRIIDQSHDGVDGAVSG